jgi:ribonuclease BN (tRNA processing enzyme)
MTYGECSMKLVVVGCFGAYPPRNGATSGYLVEDHTTKVLLDCGSGVIANLQNYINLNELDAVVFSHYHRDHCADLECMQYATMIDMQLGKRKRPLVMWGNEDAGVVPSLDYEKYCIGMRYVEHVPFTIGGLRFTTQANKHDIPSFSIKVEDSQGGCIVYSGDTEYYDRFCDFTEGADWLLCECSLYSDQRGQVEGHLCAAEVGQIAAKAKVRNLMLTHLPNYGDRESLIKEAGAIYGGKIVLAYPGIVLKI